MNREHKMPATISEKVERIQFILASIIGSIVIVEWIATWDLIRNIFLPKHIDILDNIRIGIASFGLILGCLIGINAILWVAGRALEFKDVYSKLLEDKRLKDKQRE